MRKIRKGLSIFILFAVVLGIMPMSVASAASTGIPGKPSLTHNQWGSDVDGNYDLMLNMWYGNNATSFKVYERFGPKGEFTVINEGNLEDNTPNPQEIVTEVRNREKNGIYYYYAEFINTHGTVKSDKIEVSVGASEKANIYIDGVDDNGVQTQFTVEQGTTEYKLTHISGKNEGFDVISNNRDSVVATVKGDILKIEAKSHGRSGIKIIDKKTGDVRHVGVRVKKANGELPGMPDYLSVGQVSEDRIEDLEFWRDTDHDYTNKRTDVRYIYINGGPFSGWRTWTSEDGARAKTFIKESKKQGMIPFFVYYNIPDDKEDFQVDLQHINDEKYMEAYFKDLKFFLDICKEYGQDDTIGIIFEPDFLGYMMQQSGKNPDQIPAVVDMIYKAGVLEEGKDPKFGNNVKGLVEAINYTVDKYYKEAYYGWQFNIWAYAGEGVPGQGLLHQTEYLGWDKGREFIKDAATKTAEYYKNSGITSYGADFISIDKYGLDGAYETGAPEDPEKSRWFWNADIWDNYLHYTKTLSDVTNLPAVLWQIPVGHINNSQTMSPYDNQAFDELKNVAGSYEDSATTYFFGDTFKAGNAKRLEYFSRNEANDPKIKVEGDTITWGSHMEEVRDSNIVSVLFGAGVGASTDAVGSPPTDDYFWITKAQYYYDKVVMLAGGKPVEKPLKPEVTVDKTENDGNYNVKLEIPKDSKATDYKLYENDKVIKEGKVTSDKLTVSVDMKDKAEGEYIYKAELKNKDGITVSSSIKVTVKKEVVVPQEKPKKPSISVDKAQNKGDYKVTGTIVKDSNGKTFKLYENDKVIEEGVVDNKEQVVTKNFKGKAVGKYTYKIELINEAGTTWSETIEVIVEKDEVTPPPVGDTYDQNKVYNTGDKVIYKGKEYTAKWWVKGEAPDKSAAWEVTPEIGEDGTQIYVPGKAYNGGDIVSYNGAKYKAKWWTNSTPGSDESWSKI